MNRKESEASIAKTSKITNRWKEVRSSLIEVATNASGMFCQVFLTYFPFKENNYKLTRTKLHNYKYLIFSDDYEEDNKLEEEKPSEYVRFFIILLELRIEC